MSRTDSPSPRAWDLKSVEQVPAKIFPEAGALDQSGENPARLGGSALACMSVHWQHLRTRDNSLTGKNPKETVSNF